MFSQKKIAHKFFGRLINYYIVGLFRHIKLYNKLYFGLRVRIDLSNKNLLTLQGNDGNIIRRLTRNLDLLPA